jgi:hypothetical protein
MSKYLLLLPFVASFFALNANAAPSFYVGARGGASQILQDFTTVNTAYSSATTTIYDIVVDSSDPNNITTTANNLDATHTQTVDNESNYNAYFSNQQEFDLGLTFGASIGVNLDESFSIEVAYDYISDVILNDKNSDATTSSDVSKYQREFQTVFVNAYHNFSDLSSSGLTPYIGVGVGAIIAGTLNEIDLEEISYQMQGIVGAKYAIDDNISITADVRAAVNVGNSAPFTHQTIVANSAIAYTRGSTTEYAHDSSDTNTLLASSNTVADGDMTVSSPVDGTTTTKTVSLNAVTIAYNLGVQYSF